MILKLSCSDRRGLVAEITGFLAAESANILEMSQFTDASANWFFMRADFEVATDAGGVSALKERFSILGNKLKADWTLREAEERTPTAILVSHERHCLLDLLARIDSGEIPIDLKVVLSNHTTLEQVAARAGIPFVCLPVQRPSRDADLANYGKVIADHGADLIIMARFMQILPPDLCARFAGRAINIHHSFLPAFTGAQPYRQAFERGVKIIGATAHYATAELDAGPIIDQEVSRVEHFHTPADLQRLGRDCECLALARAVRFHCRDRVLLHGNKTIVFRD